MPLMLGWDLIYEEEKNHWTTSRQNHVRCLSSCESARNFLLNIPKEKLSLTAKLKPFKNAEELGGPGSKTRR